MHIHVPVYTIYIKMHIHVPVYTIYIKIHIHAPVYTIYIKMTLNRSASFTIQNDEHTHGRVLMLYHVQFN